MMKKKDINIAHKRVVKLLKLKGIYIFYKHRKIKDAVKAFNLFFGISIDKTLEDLFNDPGSPIYKYKTLPTLPLTNKQYERRFKRKSKIERVKTKMEIYNEYLNSSKWISFKNRLKKERGNKCEICSSTKVRLEGHHLTYERFGNELPEDIQIVCKNCHKNIHQRP